MYPLPLFFKRKPKGKEDTEMKMTTFTVGDTDYNMVLRARDLASLENKIKRNPLSILFDIEQKNEMPQLKDILAVLFYGLQKEHKKEFNNFEKIYDLYDKFVENEGSYPDMIGVVVELFQNAGLIPSTDEEADEKNA